jgi:hypothetical protein
MRRAVAFLLLLAAGLAACSQAPLDLPLATGTNQPQPTLAVEATTTAQAAAAQPQPVDRASYAPSASAGRHPNGNSGTTPAYAAGPGSGRAPLWPDPAGAGANSRPTDDPAAGCILSGLGGCTRGGTTCRGVHVARAGQRWAGRL